MDWRGLELNGLDIIHYVTILRGWKLKKCLNDFTLRERGGGVKITFFGDLVILRNFVLQSEVFIR